jgi:hypothetical protein
LLEQSQHQHPLFQKNQKLKTQTASIADESITTFMALLKFPLTAVPASIAAALAADDARALLTLDCALTSFASLRLKPVP